MLWIEQSEALVALDHNRENHKKAFHKALVAIQANPHRLHADRSPHLSSIHQARNGDCWVLAKISRISHRNPHDFQELIREEDEHR